MTTHDAHAAPLPEPERVSGVTVLIVIVIGIGIGALSVLFSAWLLGAGRAAAGPSAEARRGNVVVAARANGRLEQTLIEDSASGWGERERKLDELTHYEWIDRESGVCAIPIDRAIDLVVERGGTR